MTEDLPGYIAIVFIATTILSLLIVFWVIRSSEGTPNKKSIKILAGLIGWLGLQGLLSINGIYSQHTNLIPPRIFLFGVLPIVFLGFWLMSSSSGKKFSDSLSLKKLAYLNLVRIPVELVLLWLFLHGSIPKILTFEGWNFDIVMGLTAPFIIYYGFAKGKLSRTAILLWNSIGLVLLLFVFALAVLSAPFPLQQLAFDQPNTGLLHFPFSWLPTFVAPAVILGHLVSIRQLMKKEKAI